MHFGDAWLEFPQLFESHLGPCIVSLGKRSLTLLGISLH